MLRPLTPNQLKLLSPSEQDEYLSHLEALHRAAGKDSFLKFVGMVECPGAPMTEPEPEVYYHQRLTPAPHHKLIIEAFQSMIDGEDSVPDTNGDVVDGLMIFMRPGSAKSTYASVLAPAWIMGRRPGTNVIACSYGQDLANRFGRRVRTICRSPEYADVMGCSITGDNQAVDSWSLTNGSDYRATGMGAAVTGFRADWLVIDDPVKDREAADSPVIQEKTWNSYYDDLRTRLKPKGKVALIMTRWNELDLGGRILGPDWKGQSGLWRGTDRKLWRIINLPYISEHADDPMGRKLGERMWSEYFDQREADQLQEAAAKGGSASRAWASLYQQRPAPAEGAIMLRAYWQEWKKTRQMVDRSGEVKVVPDPPECDFVMLSYDTAFEGDEINDPSAMTAWGIFPSISTKKTGEQYHHHHAILLGSWEGHVQAADLADIIQDHYKHFRPDIILIEKRASGIQILQELKRLRLPVKPWLPPKGGVKGSKGKIPRAHAAAMMMEQGAVHYIPGIENAKTLDQCAAIGGGGSRDDRADTVTQALIYFRDRFMFQTADEEMDGEEHKVWLQEQMDRNRMSRSLYNGDKPQRRAQNERRIYSESVKTRVQDDATERMTDETRRRLYGD